MPDFFFLLCAAFFAGLVDAVVGGGGLIQVPALFAAGPQAMPATLFGTNKLASVWGTAAAASQYSRRVRIEWGAALPAALTAFIFAFAGAYAVTHLSPDLVRKTLPLILIAVAIYTFKTKHLGLTHAPLYRGLSEKLVAIAAGASIGFYDGFFGPGTGSFLVFLFVRLFGFDFLGASAAAKIVNVACNVAALFWFGWSGHVLWQLGLAMTVCNIAGSTIGSHLALRHGSGFVRKIFLVVVVVLVLKTGHAAFFA